MLLPRDAFMVILSSYFVFLFIYIQILGNDSGWPYLFALTAIIGGVQLCMLPFCPESPRYLLAIKNDEENAMISKT